jgi:UDP-glucose 4-epimerase
MKILVTGGAGYIGSFVSRQLQVDGHDVVILDDLSYGHREAVTAPIEEANLGDARALDDIFARHHPEAVMHLAAFIEVNESSENPAKYFRNNTANTALLLEAMVRHSSPYLVFSSTAAVYGTPDTIPIGESAPTAPDSPYGASKLLTELSLPWYEQAHGLKAICLRYFNAAGASLDGSAGQDHQPATHLITSAIKAALGQSAFTLHGDDYDTPDGTCIRDYIHVLDISAAHTAALGHLVGGGNGGMYNVGTGNGLSNTEVVDTVKQISGIDFEVINGPRRPGDPVRLVADASRLERELGWKPQHSDLETIVRSSWLWQSTHPGGYVSRESVSPPR